VLDPSLKTVEKADFLRIQLFRDASSRVDRFGSREHKFRSSGHRDLDLFLISGISGLHELQVLLGIEMIGIRIWEDETWWKRPQLSQYSQLQKL
jgi:hypothetical protein